MPKHDADWSILLLFRLQGEHASNKYHSLQRGTRHNEFNSSLSLLLVALLVGCQASEDNRSAQIDNNDAKSEPFSEQESKDRYLTDVSEFVNEIIEVVGPVSDVDTAQKAIEQLKQLRPRAKALGQCRGELEAAAGDPVAKEELVGYLQENGQTNMDKGFKTLQEKLGKSRKVSEYLELWQAAVDLINTAKRN